MSYVSYVEQSPDLIKHYNEVIKPKGQSMASWGRQHWEASGSGESRQKTPQNTRVAAAPAPAPAPGGNPNAVHPSYTPGQLQGSNVLPSANPANPTNQQYAQYVDYNTGPNYSTWDLINARIQGQNVSGMTGHQSMTPEATADYWIKRMGSGTTKSDFGRAHYKESVGMHEGTYKSDFVPAGTGVRRFGPATDPGPPPGTDPTTSTSADPSRPPGGETLNDVQTMDLATLTDNMMLSNAVGQLINTNSPLFRSAETRALQEMAKRGIVNSSLARQAVMDAIMNVAIPIASADVQTLQQNLYYNTDWTNKQKSDYNQYIYNSLKMKIQGAIDYTLRRGDWIAALGSTSGLSTQSVDWSVGNLPNYPFNVAQ